MAAQNVALKCTLLAHSSDKRLLFFFFFFFKEKKSISTEKHDIMTKKTPENKNRKKMVAEKIYGGEGGRNWAEKYIQEDTFL